MFCTICAERAGPGVRRTAVAGLLALAGLCASGSDIFAQQQDSILKQGFKIFGFATDVGPPAPSVMPLAMFAAPFAEVPVPVPPKA